MVRRGSKIWDFRLNRPSVPDPVSLGRLQSVDVLLRMSLGCLPSMIDRRVCPEMEFFAPVKSTLHYLLINVALSKYVFCL